MLDKSNLEFHIEKIIKTTGGAEFEKLFWNLGMGTYPDLKILGQYHDKGNDGYSIKEKMFFACWAPEEHTDNKYAVKKIGKDYSKFVKNWKKLFKTGKWIFVINREVTGKLVQKILDLNNLNDGIEKEIWGIMELTKFALRLDDIALHTIFRLPDHVLFSSRQMIKNFNPKNLDLSLDNLATLKYFFDEPKGESIELVLDILPYEDKKPTPGKIYKNTKEQDVFKIGDQVNTGIMTIENLRAIVVEDRENIYEFNRIKREHEVKVYNRFFRVKLDRIKINYPKPNEYYFLISEFMNQNDTPKE